MFRADAVLERAMLTATPHALQSSLWTAEEDALLAQYQVMPGAHSIVFRVYMSWTLRHEPMGSAWARHACRRSWATGGARSLGTSAPRPGSSAPSAGDTGSIPTSASASSIFGRERLPSSGIVGQ